MGAGIRHTSPFLQASPARRPTEALPASPYMHCWGSSVTLRCVAAPVSSQWASPLVGLGRVGGGFGGPCAASGSASLAQGVASHRASCMGEARFGAVSVEEEGSDLIGDGGAMKRACRAEPGGAASMARFPLWSVMVASAPCRSSVKATSSCLCIAAL